MDTEEGVEVVWNEVLFSDRKVFKAQEVSNQGNSDIDHFIQRGDKCFGFFFLRHIHTMCIRLLN